MQSSPRHERAHGGRYALLYSGRGSNAVLDNSYNRVFDLRSAHIVVGPHTTFSYWIFPQDRVDGAIGIDSTHVALDITFTDGTTLRDSGVVDQHGVRLHPRLQGDGGRLRYNRWNYVVSRIGATVAGKTIARIDVGYEQPWRGGPFRGYVDDITLTALRGGPAAAG